MDCSTPGFPVHHQLMKPAQTHVHRVSDTIQPSHPMSSPLPPHPMSSPLPLHIRWPKDWSFSFSISPFNEHPGLISFRMDWLDLLAAQGTLKSLLQHHSSKIQSILTRKLSKHHSHCMKNDQNIFLLWGLSSSLERMWLWTTGWTSWNMSQGVSPDAEFEILIWTFEKLYTGYLWRMWLSYVSYLLIQKLQRFLDWNNIP